MVLRRRFMTVDELTAQISADRDLTHEQIGEVLSALAEMGVPVDYLVKFQTEEE